MKTKFNNAEVCHVWAQQNQQEGEGSNIFFEGDTIYSYGHHFPMAKFYKGIVLVTTRGYSNSTCKHMNHLHKAISHLDQIHVDVIFKNAPTKKDHKNNIESMFKKIGELVLKHSRARKWDYTTQIQSEMDNMQKYVNFFSCKGVLSKSERKIFDSGVADIKSTEEVRKTVLRRTALIKSRDKKAREIAIAARLVREQENLKEWLSGDRASCYNLPEGGVWLRIFKEDLLLQTSLGITLPIDEAKRVFNFINRCKKNGTSWKRNGQTFPIGDFYQMDLITADGDMVAGCHTIKWNEIERIAKLQDWF